MFILKFKPPLSEEQVNDIVAQHESILKVKVEKAKAEVEKAKSESK